VKHAFFTQEQERLDEHSFVSFWLPYHAGLTQPYVQEKPHPWSGEQEYLSEAQPAINAMQTTKTRITPFLAMPSKSSASPL
jgi:hypothetical protein